jgi:hypothetical protein
MPYDSAALSLAVINHRVAERTAEIVCVRLYLGTAGLSFGDFVAASNVVAALEHDLTRWKALSAAIREE